MHLHRWANGYPAIKPERLAEVKGYDDALRGLGGHFDEYAFFPFLEDAGLDPRGELQPRFVEAMDKLRGGLLERIPREDGSREFVLEWRVKLAVAYVQAAVLGAPSCARDSLLESFKGPRLRLCADLGRRISSEIVRACGTVPQDVEAHMRACLFTHLRLPERAATIQYFF